MRRVVTLSVVLVWLLMTVMTVYVLVRNGPDVLVLLSLVVCVLLGAAVLGVAGEARG
jgi:hypothetical protein